jgi:hypothetical protein
MKSSDLYKINRGAESGKISLEQYEKFHAQAAADAIAGKHIEDDKKQELEKWLAEEVKDFKDDGMQFIESAAEQRAIYSNDLKQIANSHDAETKQRLTALEKSQQQQDVSIAAHIQEQRASLAKAISARETARKDYTEKKTQLDKLSEQFRVLNSNHQEIEMEVAERAEAVSKLEPEAKAAADTITKNYTKSDNFEIKASATISPGDYALQRDRAFQSKLESLSDASREARDPDVCERIEIEMKRQTANYAIDQNRKIEGLTNSSRGEQIAAHEHILKAASIRAAELDLKLESNNIKVDFTQGNVPDIRELQESEKLKDSLKSNLETVRKHEFQNAALLSQQEKLNGSIKELSDSAKELHTHAENVAASRSKLESENNKVTAGKSALAMRIAANNERSNVPGAVMTNRDKSMFDNAVLNQAETKKLSQLQKSEELSKGQGQSHVAAR